MKQVLSDDELALLRKRNRQRRLSPKTHKIAHESGRGLKELWRKVVERSKGNK